MTEYCRKKGLFAKQVSNGEQPSSAVFQPAHHGSKASQNTTVE